MSRPKTNAERVRDSRERTLDGGARQVNVILRDAAAIAALERLARRHGSMRAAIEAALKESVDIS